MSKYKTKDIIVIIIAASIFFIAIYFMLNSGGSNSDKTTPSASELVDEPDFNDSYDEKVIEKISKLKDFGSINVQNICKGDLFFIEDPLQAGSVCYALEKLGVLDTQTNSNNASAEEASRNDKRKKIIENAKTALEKYFSENKDYPNSSNNKQLAELIKSNGALGSFLPSGSESTDPNNENTRLCYSRRSATQYWLYYVSEPTSVPKECTGDDPKNIEGAQDFSVR